LKTLKKAKKILYLADNAGETIFDHLLIEELGKPVIYAVREKPVINDATKEDAYLSGIHKIAKVISSGCDAPGTILKLCSKEFLKVYKNSDLIISKGQGNYEGLSEENRPIFFLLKAKCPTIARDIGIEAGDIILLKAKNIRYKKQMKISNSKAQITKSDTNPKHEILNTKQFQMTKIKETRSWRQEDRNWNARNNLASGFLLPASLERISIFEFFYDFLIRVYLDIMLVHNV
jgi:hypothetical protein